MSQKFIGVTLPVRLGQTGMFEQSLTAIEQTRTNFKNLILTKKGERVGQPELGCDLWKILFDPINDEVFEAARVAVISAVDRWLPFIELVDFQINGTRDRNILNIQCLYRFRRNPNVQDQITISTQQLGLPTVSFAEEPTTEEETNTTQTSTQQERLARATRMRRIK